MTLYYVELTFDVVTSVHPAEDRFGRVALSVVDEDASVEEFAPVFLFGGVGAMGVQSDSQISGHGTVMEIGITDGFNTPHFNVGKNAGSPRRSPGPRPACRCNMNFPPAPPATNPRGEATPTRHATNFSRRATIHFVHDHLFCAARYASAVRANRRDRTDSGRHAR